MPNDASQNPANRWARHSGAGPGGISEVVPTEAEARRGLQPFSLDEGGQAGRMLALAVTAAVAAILAGAAVYRARQPKPLTQRIVRKVRRR